VIFLVGRQGLEPWTLGLKEPSKRALLHGAAMIKVVPSIDEDQAIG
jgi:hypothetical protein